MKTSFGSFYFLHFPHLLLRSFISATFFFCSPFFIFELIRCFSAEWELLLWSIVCTYPYEKKGRRKRKTKVWEKKYVSLCVGACIDGVFRLFIKAVSCIAPLIYEIVGKKKKNEIRVLNMTEMVRIAASQLRAWQMFAKIEMEQ